MIRTSWEGIGPGTLLRAPPRTAETHRGFRSTAWRRGDRPADQLRGHHAAQEVLAIDGEDRAGGGQRRMAEEVLELLVGADQPVHPVAAQHLADLQGGPAGGDLGLEPVAREDPEEVVVLV